MKSTTSSNLHSLLFLIVCPLILIFTGPLTKIVSSQAAPLAIGSVASALTFAATLLFLRWDRLHLADAGAAVSTRTIPRLALGFVIGVVLVALQDLVIYSGGHAHWVRGDFHPALILLSLAGYAALALREELAFRGYPLRRFESTWGTWPALLLLAIIFTLEHAAGGWTWSHSLIGPPAGAILFGMAALATRGLAVPIGIHAAFNFAQWFMGQKETAGPFQLIINPGFSAQAETLGYISYVATTLLGTAAFYSWRNHSMQSHRHE